MYHTSLQVLQDQNLREKTTRLLEQFKEGCKHKVTSRQLRWEDFKEGMLKKMDLSLAYMQ